MFFRCSKKKKKATYMKNNSNDAKVSVCTVRHSTPQCIWWHFAFTLHNITLEHNIWEMFLPRFIPFAMHNTDSFFVIVNKQIRFSLEIIFYTDWVIPKLDTSHRLCCLIQHTKSTWRDLTSVFVAFFFFFLYALAAYRFHFASENVWKESAKENNVNYSVIRRFLSST